MESKECTATVLDVASAVFGRRIVAADNFFAVGGDSVTAVELALGLEASLDREIDPDLVVSADTFGALVGLLRAGRQDAVTLSDADRAWLWSELVALAGSRRAGTSPDTDAVGIGSALAARMPAAVVAAVARLRRGETADDVLLIRNVVPAADDLGPTPASLYPGPRSRAARLREIALLGVLSLLGRPYSFASLYAGRIVQDVVPVPGAEREQTSGGSTVFLDWHVEDAFSPDRCDYFGLLCLRGDRTAVTRLAAAKNLELDGWCRDLLRRERYVILPDAGHAEPPPPPVRASVLSGSDAAPEIRFDSVYLTPADAGDHGARLALDRVLPAIERASTAYTLEPGDLLIVDNRRVVHARTAFTPRFDGADRWLMRTMVRSS